MDGRKLNCSGWQRGSTSTEYALLVALVVVVLIGTLSELGATLQHKLQDIIRAIAGAS